MEDLNCTHCGKPVPWNMARVTMNRYKQVLCPHGQIDFVKKNYPPKLQGLVIARIKESF